MPLTSTSRLSGGTVSVTRRPSLAARSPGGVGRHHRGRRPASPTVALLRVGGVVGNANSGAPSRAPPAVTWDQSADEVFVRVPLAPDVRGRDVDLKVHPTRVCLRVLGEAVLEGPVEGAGGSGGGSGGAAAAGAGEPAINVDGCFFTVEDDAKHGGRHVLLTLAKRTPGYMSWPELLESDRADDTVTRRCWLDVAIRAPSAPSSTLSSSPGKKEGRGAAVGGATGTGTGGGGQDDEGEDDDDLEGKNKAAAAETTTTIERRGRIVLGLYGNAAPRAVANFVALCAGDRREDGAGDPGAAASRDALHFLGTPFHRVIPGFMAQGGDTTFGDGTGGLSVYGDAFEDEPQGLRLAHVARGALAMANAGPDTNSSQFYLAFRGLPHLDGKHVVFGRVERGGDVLAALEAIGTPGGQPRGRAAVVGCGALPEGATEEEGAELAARMPLAEVDDEDSSPGGKGDALAWVWEQPFSAEGEEDEGDGLIGGGAVAA